MARSEQHWRKIETHLTEWAAELDKAKAHAEAEVAKVQSQYYERLAEVRAEIDRSLKRWGAELKELTRQTGTTEATAARGLEEFRARIQAELTEWQPEIEQLKARAAKTTAEAKRLAQQLGAKGQAATERLKTLMGGDQARNREGVGRTAARSDERCREIQRDAAAERHRDDRELGAPGATRGTSAWCFGKGLSVVRDARGCRGVPRSRASMTSAPPGSRFPPHGNTMRIE